MMKIVWEQEATYDPHTTAWVLPDGTKVWFCSGPNCPGFRWKASELAHPPTCNLEPRRRR